MRFGTKGTKPDATNKIEVALPRPEREGLGAALRTAFGALDRPMSDDLETRLARIERSGANRRG